MESKAKYNAAFFALYENTFLVLKEKFGEQKALEIFSEIMAKGLKKAYDAMGFKKGSVEDFARVLKARDESVGLHVEFPEVSKNKVVYRFYTDPFPNLKGKVNPKALGATYMDFKVNYLLGSEWKWKLTKHIWNGDPYIEYIITKKD